MARGYLVTSEIIFNFIFPFMNAFSPKNENQTIKIPIQNNIILLGSYASSHIVI